MNENEKTDAVQSGIAMALGWMFQEALTLAARGEDLRKVDQSELLERALIELYPGPPTEVDT